MSNDVGRPSELDNPATLRKIKDLVLQGKTDTDIANAIKVPYPTLVDWKYENFRNFNTMMTTWKHEYFVRLAEGNIPDLVLNEDKKIAADMTKFVLSTLGKSHYSNRQELTGKDGEELKGITIYFPKKNEQDLETQPETGASPS